MDFKRAKEMVIKTNRGALARLAKLCENCGKEPKDHLWYRGAGSGDHLICPTAVYKAYGEQAEKEDHTDASAAGEGHAQESSGGQSAQSSEAERVEDTSEARDEVEVKKLLGSIERALNHAYSGSAEHGSFLRRGGGEWVPSVFWTLDRLHEAIAAGERAAFDSGVEYGAGNWRVAGVEYCTIEDAFGAYKMTQQKKEEKNAPKSEEV